MSERTGGETSLSVCCLTGGGAPARTAAVLALLRPIADEVVVAVDDRRVAAAAPPLSRVADRVLVYPYGPPGDRPIAWLFAQCSCDWIFNVDDDEVASRRLVRELPEVLARRDLTHGWVARRWLYRDARTYLDEPPWSTEFQLRLVRAGSPFVQFSAEFHRPVLAHGPALFLDAPLWHLDSIVKGFDARREKALAYERERRGMRIATVAHNTGLYLPELRESPRTASVPDEDVGDIEGVLAGDVPYAAPRAITETVMAADVDTHWPGEPFSPRLYEARIELRARPESFVAAVQQTVDVRVENLGDAVWRWGKEGEPEIRLSYCWFDASGERTADEGLRTPLPADLAPGEAQIVPVHVLPPQAAGRYRLEIDLVHEHVAWFDRQVGLDVQVRPRRRIAVVGAGDARDDVLDALALVPELEPVLLERNPGATPARFGTPWIRGPRLDTTGASRTGLVVSGYRLRLAARDRRRDELLGGLGACEALVVAGADWPAGAPVGRELWRLRTTVALAQQLRLRVIALDEAFAANGLKTNVLVRGIRRRATIVSSPAEVVAALSQPRP